MPIPIMGMILVGFMGGMGAMLIYKLYQYVNKVYYAKRN